MHCLEGLRKINVRMTYHTFCIWAREFPHNDTLRLNLVLCTLKSDCCEYIQQGFIHLVSTQNFPKNSHFLPLWYARTCAYQGVRNVSFSENFAYILNGWSPVSCFEEVIGNILKVYCPISFSVYLFCKLF